MWVLSQWNRMRSAEAWTTQWIVVCAFLALLRCNYNGNISKRLVVVFVVSEEGDQELKAAGGVLELDDKGNVSTIYRPCIQLPNGLVSVQLLNRWCARFHFSMDFCQFYGKCVNQKFYRFLVQFPIWWSSKSLNWTIERHDNDEEKIFW